MNPKPQPQLRLGRDEAIEATAAAWLAQRDAGLRGNEAEEFIKWRKSDPRHEAAAARLESTWNALQSLRDFRPEAARHPDRDLLAPPAVTKFPAKAIGLAAAAAIALLLMVGWRWRATPAVSPAPAVTIYTTPAGSYERVRLPDGSILELNSDTEVAVDYHPQERRVRLARGEAHFTVAKNKARPFIVEAGTIAVRAVGTAFDVNMKQAPIEVLVTEGKVQVEDRSVGNMKSEPLSVVAAGERVFAPSGGSPQRAAPVEQLSAEMIREKLAWQALRLSFSDTPLAQVIEDFNRFNHVQLELGDAGLASLPVGGSFRADNVEAFVRLLATGGDLRVERPAPDRIVLFRGQPAARGTPEISPGTTR